MNDPELQVDQPARAAIEAPPQPELLAAQNVGAPSTKVNVTKPTGTVVVRIAPRS